MASLTRSEPSTDMPRPSNVKENDAAAKPGHFDEKDSSAEAKSVSNPPNSASGRNYLILEEFMACLTRPQPSSCVEEINVAVKRSVTGCDLSPH